MNRKILNKHIYLFELWVKATQSTEMLLTENTGLFSSHSMEFRFYYSIDLIHIDKPTDALEYWEKVEVLEVE